MAIVNFFASSVVKFPVITALPSIISACTVGVVKGILSINIPTGFPIFLFVTAANKSAPFLLNFNPT